MFPGMRGMNPRQMEMMMRKMGIRTETIEAEEVIIVQRKGRLVLKEPSVTVMIVKGDKTYQITGREVMEEGTKAKGKGKGKGKDKAKEEVVEEVVVEVDEVEEAVEEAAPPEPRAGPVYAEEDVRLVMEQTGCTEEQARKALKESDGQPAEAILRLMS